MTDKAPTPEAKPPVDAATPPGPAASPPKRSPGHRGQDVRDTVAEMAARAHEISLEAGSKMAAAMKDVISAAAGITAFAIESARDLVQYMVRRGQMTQEEADKLIRDAEEANAKRKPLTKLPSPPSATVHPHAATPAHSHAPIPSRPETATPAPRAAEVAPKSDSRPKAPPARVEPPRAAAAPHKAAAPAKAAPKKPAPKPAAKKAAKPATKAPAHKK